MGLEVQKPILPHSHVYLLSPQVSTCCFDWTSFVTHEHTHTEQERQTHTHARWQLRVFFFHYIALIPRRGPTTISDTYLNPSPNFFTLKTEWFTRRGLASSPHKEGKCPHRDCVNRFLSPQCEQHAYADERVNRKRDAVSQAAIRGSGLPAEVQLGSIILYAVCKKERPDCFTVCSACTTHALSISPAGAVFFPSLQLSRQIFPL